MRDSLVVSQNVQDDEIVEIVGYGSEELDGRILDD